MHHQTIIHSRHQLPTNPTQCAACGAMVRWPRKIDEEAVEADVTCANPDCRHVTTFLVTAGKVTGIIP